MILLDSILVYLCINIVRIIIIQQEMLRITPLITTQKSDCAIRNCPGPGLRSMPCNIVFIHVKMVMDRPLNVTVMMVRNVLDYGAV